MQDVLRELLRGSRIKVSCGAEVESVEKALDSVGGYWSSRDVRYWSAVDVEGYLVVNSHLEMYFKNKLSVTDTKLYKGVTVGEIKKLMNSAGGGVERGYETEISSEKEYKTEISLGSGVVLRTNGKVTYEGSGVIVVE